jgi:hypothetical protein
MAMASQNDILAVINEHEEGISFSDIADALGVATGAISKPISVLKKKGEVTLNDSLYLITEAGRASLETGSVPPGTEGAFPDAEKDFTKLLIDQGVAKKTAEGITGFVARTGSASVFDTPAELAERLGYYHRELLPHVRKRILEDWFVGRNIAIPQELVEKIEETPTSQSSTSKVQPDRWSLIGDTPTRDPNGELSWLQCLQLLEAKKHLQQQPPASDGRAEMLMQQNAELLKRLEDNKLNILADGILSLREEVKALKENQRTENAFTVLSNTITGSFEELKGIRADLRPMAETMIARMQPPPPPRSPAEREKIRNALPGAIASERESLVLENELFGLGSPRPSAPAPRIISDEGGPQ